MKSLYNNKYALGLVLGVSLSSPITHAFNDSVKSPTVSNLSYQAYASANPQSCHDSMFVPTLREMYKMLFFKKYDVSKSRTLKSCLLDLAAQADQVTLKGPAKTQLTQRLRSMNAALLGDAKEQDGVLNSGIGKIIGLIARYVADGMPSDRDKVEDYRVDLLNKDGTLMKKVHVQEAIELYRFMFTVTENDEIHLKDSTNLRQAYKAWEGGMLTQIGREIGHLFHTGNAYVVPDKK